MPSAPLRRHKCRMRAGKRRTGEISRRFCLRKKTRTIRSLAEAQGSCQKSSCATAVSAATIFLAFICLLKSMIKIPPQTECCCRRLYMTASGSTLNVCSGMQGGTVRSMQYARISRSWALPQKWDIR